MLRPLCSECSCKSETLGTLRFAQRAKAMQNKAVINEEKANDVNLLREQIRQLKVGDTHARLSFNFELFNVKFSVYFEW